MAISEINVHSADNVLGDFLIDPQLFRLKNTTNWPQYQCGYKAISTFIQYVFPESTLSILYVHLAQGLSKSIIHNY